MPWRRFFVGSRLELFLCLLSSNNWSVFMPLLNFFLWRTKKLVFWGKFDLINTSSGTCDCHNIFICSRMWYLRWRSLKLVLWLGQFACVENNLLENSWKDFLITYRTALTDAVYTNFGSVDVPLSNIKCIKFDYDFKFPVGQLIHLADVRIYVMLGVFVVICSWILSISINPKLKLSFLCQR